MAKQVRDSKGNLVGLYTYGRGDTQVQSDYGKGVGGAVRRAMDALGGHKEPADYKAPKQSSEPQAPVTVKKVDLAQPSSFKHGGKVKKTGYAKVHKGEVIVPADDVMSSKKKKSSKKSKKSSKKSKAPHRMHIRGAANGGYIVEHEFPPSKSGSAEPPQPSEEHQIPDLDSLKDHIEEHAANMGGNADEDEGGEGAAPAPAGM